METVKFKDYIRDLSQKNDLLSNSDKLMLYDLLDGNLKNIEISKINEILNVITDSSINGNGTSLSPLSVNLSIFPTFITDGDGTSFLNNQGQYVPITLPDTTSWSYNLVFNTITDIYTSFDKNASFTELTKISGISDVLISINGDPFVLIETGTLPLSITKDIFVVFRVGFIDPLQESGIIKIKGEYV